MKTWVKYFIEISVIIFSILAAFWLEQWRENNQEEKRRNESLQLVLEEIKANHEISKENLRILHEFNEYYSIIESLTGETYSNTKFYQFHSDTIKSIKERYPENRRVQKITPFEMIESHTGLYYFEMNIDFILPSYNFSMWEAARTSGALNGANPVTLAKLGEIYTAFQANFGYSEREYHKSLLSDYGKFGDIHAIINATYKLEQSIILRLALIDKIYPRTIKIVEETIKLSPNKTYE